MTGPTPSRTLQANLENLWSVRPNRSGGGCACLLDGLRRGPSVGRRLGPLLEAAGESEKVTIPLP